MVKMKIRFIDFLRNFFNHKKCIYCNSYDIEGFLDWEIIRCNKCGMEFYN